MYVFVMGSHCVTRPKQYLHFIATFGSLVRYVIIHRCYSLLQASKLLKELLEPENVTYSEITLQSTNGSLDLEDNIFTTVTISLYRQYSCIVVMYGI